MADDASATCEAASISAGRLAAILSAAIALYLVGYLRVRAACAYVGVPASQLEDPNALTFFGPSRGDRVLYQIFWPACAIDQRCTGRKYGHWVDAP